MADGDGTLMNDVDTGTDTGVAGADEGTNTDTNHQADGRNDNTGKTDDNGSTDAWYSTLPEDLHEHIKDFGSQEDMAKAYVDAKGKTVAAPKEIDGYSYELPQDFNLEVKDKESFDSWMNSQKTKALELGLSQKQFETAMNMSIKDMVEREEKVSKLNQVRLEEGLKSLKKDWGAEYEPRFKKADALATKFFSKDFKKFLKDTGLLINPEFVKGVYELSKLVSEDAFAPSDSGKDPNKDERPKDQSGRPMLKYESM